MNVVHPGAGLGAPGLRAPKEPFPLGAEDRFDPFLGVCGDFPLQFLFFEVPGKVPLVHGEAAVVELVDAVAHRVEEVAVVGDHEDRAVRGGEEFLEPGDGADIEVVCRLVEEDEAGIFHEDLGEGDLFDHAAREGAHDEFQVVDAEGGQDRADLGFQVPQVLFVHLVGEFLEAFGEPVGGFGTGAFRLAPFAGELLAYRFVFPDRVELGAPGFEYMVDDAVRGIESRVLRQVGNPGGLVRDDGTGIALKLPRDAAEEGTLAGAVFADEGGFVPLVEAEGNAGKERGFAAHAGKAVH